MLINTGYPMPMNTSKIRLRNLIYASCQLLPSSFKDIKGGGYLSLFSKLENKDKGIYEVLQEFGADGLAYGMGLEGYEGCALSKVSSSLYENGNLHLRATGKGRGGRSKGIVGQIVSQDFRKMSEGDLGRLDGSSHALDEAVDFLITLKSNAGNTSKDIFNFVAAAIEISKEFEKKGKSHHALMSISFVKQLQNAIVKDPNDILRDPVANPVKGDSTTAKDPVDDTKESTVKDSVKYLRDIVDQVDFSKKSRSSFRKAHLVRSVLNKSGMDPLLLIAYLEPHQLIYMKEAMTNACGQKPLIALLYDLCSYVAGFVVETEKLQFSMEELKQHVQNLKSNMKPELQKEMGYSRGH